MGNLSSPFDPASIEQTWLDFWKSSKLFVADVNSERTPYCIVLPPPNVTGYLHMGHALVNTLQDILIRYHRMLGLEVLWLPGLDHAGISTQAVVERHLLNTTGKRRQEFDRDEFLAHVWEWKEAHQSGILSQLKTLGCSCDWSRLKFTLDEDSSRSVRTMFKKLYDDGHIYQGNYLVNWDPILQTAVADDEVEHEERHSSLWYFRYPVEGTSEHIVIATTRPETLLGDTAVAVHPKDSRYKKWLGKQVRLPMTDRLIPIIADEYVDPEWGTGAVKITPAHDVNDYEVGKRHNLPMINMMNPNGTVNEEGGPFANLSMQEARNAIVLEMEKQGFIEKIVPHTHNVGVSYRSRAAIEPYLSKQWFIRMEPFKDKLMTAVTSGRVQLIPDEWIKTYCHWIENLRDWCISRQLWWGHQIPIWYHTDGRILCTDQDGIPPEVEKDPENWHQDPDVLDTWFSSGIWPLTTLGWPDHTQALKRFYPTDVLVTGHDILFFWVARMIMMGEYAAGDVPFKTAYIHGLIYGKSYWRTSKDGHIQYVSPDERKAYEHGQALPSDVQFKWEKMSKSKGNVIDPLEMIQEYGTDALRFTLAACATRSPQIDLDVRRFGEYRNFMNKIWNATAFVLQHVPSEEALLHTLDLAKCPIEDQWILAAFNQTVQKLHQGYENYTFDSNAQTLYSFFWDQFCAYYLELAKPYLYGKQGTEQDKWQKQLICLLILTHTILLLSPMTPFIAEEIFAKIRASVPRPSRSAKDPYIQPLLHILENTSASIAPYPQPITLEFAEDSAIETFTYLQNVVRSVRNIRGEMSIPPSKRTDLYILTEHTPSLDRITSHQHILTSLIPIQDLHIQAALKESPAFSSSAVFEHLTLLVPLDQELRDKERNRLTKELASCEKQIAVLSQKLQNTNFIQRAPKDLVQQTQDKLDILDKEKSQLETKIHQL